MSIVSEGRKATVARRSENGIVGHPPTTVRLVADSVDTGGALSVVEVVLEPKADGAQPHRHDRSSELFYVLNGEVDVLAGDDIVRASEGDTIVIPPMLPHAFSATAGQGAELLVVIAPGVDRFGYFRHLERIAHGTATLESLLEVQDEYDTHFLDSAVWRIRGRDF